MNTKELVEKLNELKILQTSEWQEHIPDEIWYQYFKENQVKHGLNVEKHRWYETTITVIQVANGFIGVRSITQVYSESSSIEDCFFTLEFYEMNEVTIKSYEIKK